MQLVLTILGEEVALDCAPAEERRLRDLAAALSARLAAIGAERAEARHVLLAALALTDEVQAARAALVRAQGEIERLTDMVVEARLAADPEAIDENLGRVGALRPPRAPA